MNSGSNANSCLRPSFTRELADRLMQGKSVNLVSPHGQGRRRTLHDLCNTLPQSILIVKINLKLYHNDYIGFINAIKLEAGDQYAACSSLDELIVRMAECSQMHLIILHNFDLLYGQTDVDERFDNRFFDLLNTISEHANLVLLSVCESRSDTDRILAEPMQLPPLSKDQIMVELAQRSPIATDAALAMLADQIAHHPSPYTRLNELTLQQPMANQS